MKKFILALLKKINPFKITRCKKVSPPKGENKFPETEISQLLLEISFQKWREVKPVIIIFGGEKITINYWGQPNPPKPNKTPAVAFVHSYLRNSNLESTNH